MRTIHANNAWISIGTIRLTSHVERPNPAPPCDAPAIVVAVALSVPVAVTLCSISVALSVTIAVAIVSVAVTVTLSIAVAVVGGVGVALVAAAVVIARLALLAPTDGGRRAVAVAFLVAASVSLLVLAGALAGTLARRLRVVAARRVPATVESWPLWGCGVACSFKGAGQGQRGSVLKVVRPIIALQ